MIERGIIIFTMTLYDGGSFVEPIELRTSRDYASEPQGPDETNKQLIAFL